MGRRDYFTLPILIFVMSKNELEASQVVLEVKNLPAGDIRDVGSIPESEDPLEEGLATPFSVLAWRIPWTEDPGRLQSIESQSDMMEVS